MTEAIYHDLFSKWEDVKREFGKGVPDSVQHVIFAGYEYESYSGNACVIYYDQGKYYVNDGGHCSCYGLEDQWKPVDYPDAETLRACLAKADYGLASRHKSDIDQRITEVQAEVGK